MNQRLLVILALLLLVVGVLGLKFSGNDRVETVDVVIFTALRPLEKGEVLTKDSYNRQVVQRPANEAPTGENLPESLEAYQAINTIAEGAVLTRDNIVPVSRETVFLKEDHYIYPLRVSSADLFLLTRLKKGDEVNIYLRYFVRKKEDEAKSIDFVDHKGKNIIGKNSKLVMLSGPKRFLSISKTVAEGRDADKSISNVTVNIELNSDDITRIYAVRHLGDAVVFPASASPVNNKQGAIPELVTQLRGKLR